MPRLTQEQKVFVVTQLAHDATSGEVVRLFKETYGVAVTPSQVCFYDPRSVQGSRELSPELRGLFAEERDKYLRGLRDGVKRPNQLDDAAAAGLSWASSLGSGSSVGGIHELIHAHLFQMLVRLDRMYNRVERSNPLRALDVLMYASAILDHLPPHLLSPGGL